MPTDPQVEGIHKWVDDHSQEMVETLQSILRIPTVESDPEPGAPFGKGNREALDFTLDLGESWGFSARNLEGYAGHAEFGEGDEMVMALGHLDVVPVGDGWKHAPFAAEIDGGYIYARGANDDKGPTYASFFAARALKELGVSLKRRVRVVFGCNEESGFGCVRHYFEHEPAPAYGFAPDAGFPVIYAEKGIANLTLEAAIQQTGDLRLVSVHGGQRPNMVPDMATAVLEGDTHALNAAVTVLNEFWDRNINFRRSQDHVTVHAIGKAFHGSEPWGGDNAVTRVLRVLGEMPLDNNEWIKFLIRAADPGGGYLGYSGHDEVAGSLTNNLGVLEFENGTVRAIFNIRYPVTWDGETLPKMADKALTTAGFTVASFTNSKPLYVPLDKEPVKTLVEVYREETGDMKEPGTMGGGTYARAVPNTVAVGAGFPGDGPAHERDERYAVSSYIKCAKIYARMLYRLANL